MKSNTKLAPVQADAPKHEPQAKWKFNQDGLPRGSFFGMDKADEYFEALNSPEGKALIEKEKGDFQSAVYWEAHRCLDTIAHWINMPVERIPAAVEEIGGHLILLGRNYRWGVLHPLLEEFEDYNVIFWPLLFQWWSDGEGDGPRSLEPLIERALEQETGWCKGWRPYEFMEFEDQTFLRFLPETVTIYRGTYRRGTDSDLDRRVGISWTTDRTKAEWFARRFALNERNPVLLTGRVRKRHIIACFTGRNENEVLVLPKHVRGRTEEELPAEPREDK